MTQPQWMILAILVATLGLFLYGRWRHDIVSAAALLATVLVGLVPAEEAFLGFSHPAVVTVACVLILSAALLHTGVVDLLAQRVLPTDVGPTLAVSALATLAAVLSSFMNNVGALALLMPIAMQMAQRQGIAPGKVLMPLSFATMLGGMTTLIGTPSNLIVSSFRTYGDANGFQMFDFAPVGVAVAVGGIVFIGLVGWRIVPARERAGADSFDTGAYLTEARVAANSKAIGMVLKEAESALEDADAQIISLVRNEVRVAPHAAGPLQEGDVVLIEADPEALANALDSLGLVFGEGKSKEQDEEEEEAEEKEKEEPSAEEEGEEGISEKEHTLEKAEKAGTTSPSAASTQRAQALDENPTEAKPEHARASPRAAMPITTPSFRTQAVSPRAAGRGARRTARPQTKTPSQAAQKPRAKARPPTARTTKRTATRKSSARSNRTTPNSWNW